MNSSKNGNPSVSLPISESKARALREENATLNEENATLSKEKATLSKENAALKAEVEHLKQHQKEPGVGTTLFSR